MTLINTLRKSLAALGMLLMAAAPASAADVYNGGLKDQPVYVAPTWQGFYVGVHGGGFWSQLDVNRNVFVDQEQTCDTKWDKCNKWKTFTTPFGGNNLDGSGGFGGGTFGYNWQGGSNCCFVYGIEVDLGFADIGNQDRTFAIVNGRDDLTRFVRVKSDGGGFYGDVTGRLGYVWGQALVYAKGGFAWLNTNFRANEVINDDGGHVLFNSNNNGNNNTLTGWTLGAGVEYMLGTNWTVKVEYLHFDFGNVENNHCCGDGIVDDWRIKVNNDFRFFNHDLTADTVKVGLNYYIRPAAPLPYK